MGGTFTIHGCLMHSAVIWGLRFGAGGPKIGWQLHIAFKFFAFQISFTICHLYEVREMRRAGCSLIFDVEL